MNIRAHHFLCMRYFRGKGYSPEFVSNFERVLEKLKDNPLVKVTNSADAICKACPHLKNDKCMKKPDSEAKVKKKDEEIMNILGLKTKQNIETESIRSLVNERLVALRKTCKDCEWNKICV